MTGVLIIIVIVLFSVIILVQVKGLSKKLDSLEMFVSDLYDMIDKKLNASEKKPEPEMKVESPVVEPEPGQDAGPVEEEKAKPVSPPDFVKKSEDELADAFKGAKPKAKQEETSEIPKKTAVEAERTSPPPMPVSRKIAQTEKQPARPVRATADLKAKPLAAIPGKEPSEFEKKALDVLREIWMWIIVGDDYRRKDISREYAIASTWLVRLSVIILLLGGVFFLKYSIENGLLQPPARVMISSLSALLMLGGGVYMTGKDKKYDIIGRAISGGGIALSYFSVFAASSMYHLIGLAPAFALMILITATAFAVSVRKNVMLMAIIGILGGYLTPVLLSTGEKNLYGLFSYMLILGIGTLAISKYRNWKLLNWLSFAATYILYFASLGKFFRIEQDYAPAIIFACAYFVLFSCMAVSFNIFNRKKTNLLELLTLLGNTAIFLTVTWVCTVEFYDRAWVACFSLGAAAYYIGHIIWFLNGKLRDRNLIITLFGLSVFCLVLTFPLALSGAWISAAWSAMAVLLIYLGLRTGSRFLMVSSYIVYLITAFRVFAYDYMMKGMDRSTYLEGLKDHLISGGMLCMAFLGGYLLLKRYGDKMPDGMIRENNDLPVGISPSLTGKVFMWISVALGFLFLNIEIPMFAKTCYPMIREPLTALLWSGMLIFLCRMLYVNGSKAVRGVVVCFVILFSFKLLLFDINAWHLSTSHWAYGTEFLGMGSLLRCIGFLTLTAAMLFGVMISGKRSDSDLKNFFAAAFLIQLFVFLTLEVSSLLYFFAPGFRAGGVSIVWGLYGFSMITTGIRKNAKGLRYAGLGLFAVDVFKIFMYDLDNLSQLYRIIAFIILGLVFMAGGFVYIKCREKFCVDNQDNKEGNSK